MDKRLPLVPCRTTPGFAFSMVERAISDCLAARRFGVSEKNEVILFFGQGRPECAYCGSNDVKRWDHIVPISKGGDTVLGNMVLACASCDDSKRDLLPDEWVVSGGKSSPKTRGIPDIDERLEKIRAYVLHFKYVPKILSDKLDEHEQRELEAIRSDLRKVRAGLERLIATHRARTVKR